MLLQNAAWSALTAQSLLAAAAAGGLGAAGGGRSTVTHEPPPALSEAPDAGAHPGDVTADDEDAHEGGGGAPSGDGESAQPVVVLSATARPRGPLRRRRGAADEDADDVDAAEGGSGARRRHAGSARLMSELTGVLSRLPPKKHVERDADAAGDAHGGALEVDAEPSASGTSVGAASAAAAPSMGSTGFDLTELQRAMRARPGRGVSQLESCGDG